VAEEVRCLSSEPAGDALIASQLRCAQQIYRMVSCRLVAVVAHRVHQILRFTAEGAYRIGCRDQQLFGGQEILEAKNPN
jgi:hypothetical protein